MNISVYVHTWIREKPKGESTSEKDKGDYVNSVSANLARDFSFFVTSWLVGSYVVGSSSSKPFHNPFGADQGTE